ncbi:MAG: hypothetical protein IJM30_09645 [Thermoguttaceae bacterium]|nr:hypothetical protein [Thermoguttaceae bacterium]
MPKIVLLALPTLFVAFVAPILADDPGASSPSRARVVWKPSRSSDPLERDLRFVRSLVELGAVDLAARELESLEGAPLESSSSEVRDLYGVVATELAMEAARLTSVEGRREAFERIEAIRESLLGADGKVEAISTELAVVRALVALGRIADAFGDDAAETYLNSATEKGRGAVESLPVESAKPFVYYCAEAAEGVRSDPKRFERAEKLASFLVKNSTPKRDEYYFYARLALARLARERGDLDDAALKIDELVAETGAPAELALGLLAEKSLLLLAKGDTDEAVRLAASEVDLRGESLPENLFRFADRLPDLFFERDLASQEVFWRASESAPEEREGAAISNVATKGVLLEAARNAGARARTSSRKALVAGFARSRGMASTDRNALELSAESAFRSGDLLGALDAYDAASREASAEGDSETAYRLERVAAGVADKALRERVSRDREEFDEPARRADVARRFEALAKSRPESEDAPSFMLLAIDRGAGALPDADRDALRLDFARLFPNDPNRDGVALTLARDLFSRGDLEGASSALDLISPDGDSFPAALDLERQLFAARSAESDATPEAALVAELARSLAKTSFLDRAALESLATPVELLDAATDAIPSELSLGDERLLACVVETSQRAELERDPGFAAALERLLTAWGANSSDESFATRRRVARLGLAIASRSPEELVALIRDGAEGVDADALAGILARAETAPEGSKKRLAKFVLDASKSLEDQKSARVKLLRADASRLLGDAQGALNLYAALVKENPRNPGALKGLATLLGSRSDKKARELAIKYWSDLADLREEGSPEWWDAKERCVELYCKLGDKTRAEKMVKALWTTRTDPSDPDRKRRWERLVSGSGK